MKKIIALKNQMTVLPIEGPWEALEALGVKRIGTTSERSVCTKVLLPEGWKLRPRIKDHRFSDLIDNEGNIVTRMFYEFKIKEEEAYMCSIFEKEDTSGIEASAEKVKEVETLYLNVMLTERVLACPHEPYSNNALAQYKGVSEAQLLLDLRNEGEKLKKAIADISESDSEKIKALARIEYNKRI